MNICRRLTVNSLVARKTTGLTMSEEIGERILPRLCNTISANSFDITKEKVKFVDALPGIIEDLAKHPKFQELPAAKEWMKKVINGTVTGGKFSRGLTAVMTYKMVEKPENITEEKLLLARTLGWCTEFLQAFCIILDDIVDGSSTRRGMPCWYKREDVGLVHAVNDSILVHCCLQKILQNNFGNSPIYVKLFQAYNETLFYTCIGQFLDIKGSENKKKYDNFTTQNYEDIIINKSAYYTYKLPISVGLMLANHMSEETIRNCEEISLQLGKLFQMQDDYIDCFGDELLTGKIGTDIQEGKCSWLAVNALQRCDAKKRAVFVACYGSKEPAHIERIKQLYLQLNIPQVYKQEELNIYNSVTQRIETVSSAAERDVFKLLLDMVYDRKK